MELRRFFTAGEVDDGKSTLIGRLFFDAGFIRQDQLDSLKGNLAHFTDGLRAERAQGITMDTAYRFFETPSKKFIVADAPGHLPYIRHMVTAASLADAAVILIDAKRGVSTQTRRHAWLARWLGVPSIVFVVNKMDCFDFSQEIFENIKQQLGDYTEATFIPASALNGDNVLHHSVHTPWYQGPTLMTWLQQMPAKAVESPATRFSVQYVLNDQSVVGTLLSGELNQGDSLSSTQGSVQLSEMSSHPHNIQNARAGQHLHLKIQGAKLQRGDLIYYGSLEKSQQWEAEWLFFHETDANLIAMTHAWKAEVKSIQVEQSWDWEKETWELSAQTDFPRLQKGRIEFTAPLSSDVFNVGTQMGQMILVNQTTGATVAAVLLRKSC